MEGHYVENDNCEDCNDYDSDVTLVEENNKLSSEIKKELEKPIIIDYFKPYNHKNHLLEVNMGIFNKLPIEVLNIIIDYVLKPMLDYRKNINIIKSNKPKEHFKEYDFYHRKNEVYEKIGKHYRYFKKDFWKKFKIGDKIITSPVASWGYNPIETYIRCYCPNCKDINDRKNIKLRSDYFENSSNYYCKSCDNGPSYGMYAGVAPSENVDYTICRNCFESFNVYQNKDGQHIYDTSKLCNDCINLKTLKEDYDNMDEEYKEYLSCSDCYNLLPKFCMEHKIENLLKKYENILKECSYCKRNIKVRYETCNRHKYWFM